METLFLICALVGGTVMVCQLAMSLLGLGHHGFDLGGDGGLDVGHDFSGHGGMDHSGADHSGADHGDGGDTHPAHSSSWYFGIITFQTVVAAVTFFGLAGMAASTAEIRWPLPLLIGLASGGAAMLGVHSLMKALYKLRSDGTERIGGAVGREGTVYLSIPGHNQGTGKIHLSLQDRLVEYAAVTSGEALPTGAKIVVVDVLGSDTVAVEAITEAQPAASS